MKANARRLKVLLAILVVLVYAFIGIVLFMRPEVDASNLSRWKKRPSPSPTVTRTPTPSPATPSPSSSPSASLFSDNFSGTLSKWQQVYNGYGTVQIESGLLSMSPQASVMPSETHAPLVTAGSTAWGDYIYDVQMNSVQQLRTGSAPNPWEVGWILFRYVDATNFYYFLEKPNGIELGKLVNGSQVFLATAEAPKLAINTWHTYKVTLKGANIKIAIDGTQIVNYTDSASPFLTGKVGLYNEDAHVHYDNVFVTSN